MLILFSYQPPRARWCGSRGRRPRVFTELFYLVLVVLLAVAGALAGAPVEEKAAPRLYLDYSAKPSPENLAAFDLCILDPAAEVDLEPGHSLGNRYLAYVSTVEARAGSVNEIVAKAAGIPFAGKNESWGTRLVDVAHPGWLAAMMEKVVHPAVVKGFDGIFLDTVDSVALLGKTIPGHEKPAREAIAALIREVKKKYPDQSIVVNRGFDLLPEVKALVSGVLVESVFRTCDPKTRTYAAVSAEGTAWIVERIREVQRVGLPVYAVDYVPAAERQLAKATAEKLAALGCVPFVTTIDLQGAALAPVCEVARRVLVLFGWDPSEAERPAARPADTLTARALQSELEWLGCEAEYLDIGARPLPAELPAHIAGVIMDAQAKPRFDQEIQLVTWLAERAGESIPVLFTGSLPWTSASAKAEFARRFGVAGTGRSLPGLSEARVAALDGSVMNGAAPIKPRVLGFADVQAPPGARVFISLMAKNRSGTVARFDPVFLAPWGGVWLDPYVVAAPFEGAAGLGLDAVAFFKEWLRGASFPMPDASTLDGRRVFHSELLGDGFSTPSHFPGHPSCAEVMRDRILSRLPLPVTVAVSAEQLGGRASEADHDTLVQNENIARAILAMPHTQAGVSGVEAANGSPAEQDTLEQLGHRLLTKKKAFEIALWSGPTAPGAKAMELCRGAGLVCGPAHEHRAITASPRTLLWNDEVHVIASQPDDIALTKGFEGPAHGGFSELIKRLQRTESPRRIAPAEVRFHFASAARLSSLRAVEEVFRWCLSQPLHPVTARQYSLMATDARRAKIFELAANHWLVTSAGMCRTLRLDPSAGVPDLERSTGIAGWRREGSVLYVHTLGVPRVELVMSGLGRAPSAARPWLVESSAGLRFHQINRQRAVMDVQGWRAAEVVFAGLLPHGHCRVSSHGKIRDEHADAAGRLNLSLPPRTTITLDFCSTPDVALH